MGIVCGCAAVAALLVIVAAEASLESLALLLLGCLRLQRVPQSLRSAAALRLQANEESPLQQQQQQQQQQRVALHQEIAGMSPASAADLITAAALLKLTLPREVLVRKTAAGDAVCLSCCCFGCPFG